MRRPIEGPGGRRPAGRAVLAAVTGDAGASVDPVGAVAFVLTQVRATLWLAAQDQLNAVEPTTWLRIGCANVARGLQALSGVEAPQV